MESTETKAKQKNMCFLLHEKMFGSVGHFLFVCLSLFPFSREN